MTVFASMSQACCLTRPAMKLPLRYTALRQLWISFANFSAYSIRVLLFAFRCIGVDSVWC